MSDLSHRLLETLAGLNVPVSSIDLANQLKEDHQRVVGAIKSLQGLGEVDVNGVRRVLIEVQQQQKTDWVLRDEGQEIARHGSHEFRVLRMVVDGKSKEEIEKGFPFADVGLKKALAQKWIEYDKAAPGNPLKATKKGLEVAVDEVGDSLKRLEAGDSAAVSENVMKDFKKRNLVDKRDITIFLVSKGPDFTTNVSKAEADLTVEMLTKDAWKEKKFKDYNFEALGAPPAAGYFHPLMKVRSEFRQIFLEMGFVEMPTNNFVESSFWNFDALFVPQQHPARDVQDTFFVSDPAEATSFPPDYLERVRTVHSKGGYGSAGYNTEWSEAETRKNILRTHTTAVSARMLYKLAQQKEFTPAKYFSIDRVFRNENLDATHLAEFHQIEGVVADYDLSLGHLIGILHAFFNKLGITKLRFKPAYNPYTEPSMEVFSYHEGLKKWVEVGNSGVFRPEMLLPMGLPENVSVIAWGLSLERPTMIKYGVDNIRDLVGHKVDLQMVQANPICRLDK
ncbi:Phenylalanine--tRNA ligase alpha subunit B [Hypsibius exemplaris]|uniref:phenylalanine--tRNA ligase n=1 Tax=Hypsibius exemplaris TaxID=2072580 RepID=A0A1W0XB71_HYPEX|nr:Phenylalanine--tRNA ligase alpha subunit B [Hypsibius exemplaris]